MAPIYPLRWFPFIPLSLPLFQPQTHKRKFYHLLYFVLAFSCVWNLSSTSRYLHSLSRPPLSFCLNIFIFMRPSLITKLKISPPCILLLCLQHLLTHYTVFLNYFAILPFCPQGLPNINTATSALWMKACLCLCLCFDQQLGQDRCSVIICGSNWQGHRLSMVEELGLSLNIYLT